MTAQTAVTLSREGLTLLLKIGEDPFCPEIIGRILFAAFPDLVNELLSQRWLLPCGISPHHIDHTLQDFVRVEHDGKTYGYYHPTSQWTPLPTSHVTRYCVNDAQLQPWLQALLTVDDYYRITPVVDAVCWYLGVAHSHPYRTHVYFARQLHAREAQKALGGAMEAEVGHVPALIVHSGQVADYGVTWPLDRRLVPLDNLLVRTDQRCQLHQPTLAALIKGLYCDVSPEDTHKTKALHFSTDYRQVYWRGESYQLTKKQSAVIEALHKAGGRTHKDFLCAAANTNTPLYQIFRSKIDNRYQPHPLWQTLIVSEGDGYYALSSA
jgi:hypothetical protein